jgi:hypothetical protein
VIQFPLRSAWSRAAAGLVALALFGAIIWWGAASHELGTTLEILVAMGALLVGGRLLLARFRHGRP